LFAEDLDDDRVLLSAIEAAVEIVLVEKPWSSNEPMLDDPCSAATACHVSSLEDLQPGLL
jgi:hypothetical protein